MALLNHATIFPLLVAGCTPLIPSSAPDPLCAALDRFSEYAKESGEPQELILFKEEENSISCLVQEGNAAQNEYCESVLDLVSMEFTHLYPWQVRACIRADGGKVHIETANEYTGLGIVKKIVQLDGTLRIGTKVHIQFEAVEGQDDSEIGPYWGRYILTLTP